ncbi:MAG: winged helix DNA-binding protein, partial [Bacteroidales bacterium]|nr:winged helix DNA-binding protein [Bacteroidales bacterium]
ILRRLAAKGLISEFPDMSDKRKVRVSVTEKGKSEIRKLLPEMSMAAGIISGNLTLNEKNTLLFLLKKLDYFHNDIFINSHDLSLGQLLENQDTGINTKRKAAPAAGL